MKGQCITATVEKVYSKALIVATILEQYGKMHIHYYVHAHNGRLGDYQKMLTYSVGGDALEPVIVEIKEDHLRLSGLQNEVS